MFDKMPNLKKFKGKKVVIPWSGGLDSTGLLLAMADAGAEVTALSIQAENMPNPNHEKYSRHLIKTAIRDSDLYDKIKFQTFKFPSIDGFLAWPNNFRWSQKQLWLYLSSLLTPMDTDYVAIGAVSDDNIMMIPNLKKQWKSMGWNIKDKAKLPELIFPLTKTSKATVAEWIHGYTESNRMKPIIDYVSFCEQTTKIGGVIYGCGTCPSCIASHGAGLSILQPRADSKNGKDAFASLLTSSVEDKARRLVYVKETESVNSFYITIEAEFGDGTDTFYRGSNPLKVTIDSIVVIYLGMCTGTTLNDVDFEHMEELPSDSIIVNGSEYKARKLTYLVDNGYYDVELNDHIELVHQRTGEATNEQSE